MEYAQKELKRLQDEGAELGTESFHELGAVGAAGCAVVDDDSLVMFRKFESLCTSERK